MSLSTGRNIARRGATRGHRLYVPGPAGDQRLLLPLTFNPDYFDTLVGGGSIGGVLADASDDSYLLSGTFVDPDGDVANMLVAAGINSFQGVSAGFKVSSFVIRARALTSPVGLRLHLGNRSISLSYSHVGGVAGEFRDVSTEMSLVEFAPCVKTGGGEWTASEFADLKVGVSSSVDYGSHPGQTFRLAYVDCIATVVPA